MLPAIAALFLGLIFLAFSADRFVVGAAVTSRKLGIPPLLVGMVVIGFGSSMPEIAVSVIAAARGNPGLALGNVYGSNITNIALILGVTAMVKPVSIESSVLKRELPVLILITLVCTLLLGWDQHLGRPDGWLLIAAFLVLMAASVYVGLTADANKFTLEDALTPSISLPRALVYLFGGLIVLVISSRVLVWGGITFATLLGISDLIIGLTVIAIGTSLPELASSIVAVRRNEHDLALGNVIGSNLCNTTLVIGVTGVIIPTRLPPDMILRDLPILVCFTLLLFVFCYGFKKSRPKITRPEALTLLLCYGGYNALLFSQMIQ